MRVLADDSETESTATRRLRRVAAQIERLGDLKRVFDASSSESVAGRLFRRAWAALAIGVKAETVADAITADALIATELGAVDRDVLATAGLGADAIESLLLKALERAGPGGRLAILAAGPSPGVVDRLVRQPRAGATAPDHRRLILQPAETHGDHCLVVAVGGVLAADVYGADRATVFVAGLAHHLHNARLPDSGFAGETHLGEHLNGIVDRLFAHEIAALPERLRPLLHDALRLTGHADTPEGRAFHAADVMDRVLEVRHFERVARFRAEQALQEMQLVHAGPVQAFHMDVLRVAGLW